MAFEITCGQCGGRLLVETAGVVVSCPMCDAHLEVPDPDVLSDTDSAAPLAPTTSADSQIVAGVLAAAEAVTAPSAEPAVPPAETPESGEDILDEPNPSQPTEWMISHSTPQIPEFVLTPEEPPDRELFQVDENVPDFSLPGEGDAAAATVQLPSTAAERSEGDAPTLLGTQPLGTEPAPVVIVAEASTQSPVDDVTPTVMAPVAQAPQPPPAFPPVVASSPSVRTTPIPPAPASAILATDRHDTVPRQWFILVAGYASAVTLLLLYLLVTYLTRGPHPLESLPDLVPPMDQSGNIGMKVVPPELDVAPGHELRLGQSQRFGSLKVTPLRVTRGPLQFEHAFGKKQAHREPTEPVLKLWVRFENVSRDQEFAPLDATLLYKRIFDRKSQKLVALNFLGPVDERRSNGRLHFLYDMPEYSEFVMSNQNLSRLLKPDEFWETYIPSEEGYAEPAGEWVWRVLFRKGYNPQSKRGVTTLIDVRFDASEIITETNGSPASTTG